jgi:ABC-type glycerol-3-phosphate transport system substrate-binding protein
MKIVSLNEKTWDELKTSEKILKESPGCPCVGSPLMDGCGGGSCYTNSGGGGYQCFNGFGDCK